MEAGAEMYVVRKSRHKAEDGWCTYNFGLANHAVDVTGTGNALHDGLGDATIGGGGLEAVELAVALVGGNATGRDEAEGMYPSQLESSHFRTDSQAKIFDVLLLDAADRTG